MSDKSLQAIQDVVRAPFYQYENSSRGYGNDSFFDQLVINMIPERMEDTDTQTVKQQLSKRPGISGDLDFDWLTGLVNDPGSCSIRDFITITAVYDVCVAAVFDSSDNNFYIIQIRPITQSALLIGSGISGGTADDIYLTEISQTNGSGSLLPGTAVHWVKGDLTDSAGYWALTSAGVFDGVLHDITNTAFPANQTPALITTGRFVNQRGTFYIATLDGQVFNSYAGQNDINDWDNANGQIGSIQCNMYPDQLLGIERHKNNIIAFSRNSIEFFNDVGTTPSTLAAIDQIFIKFGAVKPNLIRNIDDILYWVAYGVDGQTGLWRLDGYTPVKLSTPYVDALIEVTAANLNIYRFQLQSCIMHGKRQIFLNGIVARGMVAITDVTKFSSDDTFDVTVTDARTASIVCNVEDKTWWGFNFNSSGDNIPYFATSFASPSQGELYTQVCLMDWNLGNSVVFFLTSDAYYDGFTSTESPGDDVQVPVCAYVQINPLWFGNEKRKRISKFKVITNTVPTKATGDTNTYSMYLVYTKDNLATTSGGFLNTTVRRMDHPAPQGRYVLNNLGMGRVWNFAILDKSPMNLRLNSFELDIQQGSH